MLLLGVPEVEEEVGHESQSSLAHPVDFSDDRGPRRVREYPQSRAMKRYVHQNSLPGTRYRENESGLSRRQYWIPTFSMDPQKGTLRVPLGEGTSIAEPRRSSILMNFARGVVVR